MPTQLQLITLDAVRAQIARTHEKSLADPTLWWAVRVSPEGHVYEACEQAAHYPADERRGQAPHTVTVWSSDGTREPGDLAGMLKATGLEIIG